MSFPFRNALSCLITSNPNDGSWPFNFREFIAQHPMKQEGANYKPDRFVCFRLPYENQRTAFFVGPMTAKRKG